MVNLWLPLWLPLYGFNYLFSDFNKAVVHGFCRSRYPMFPSVLVDQLHVVTRQIVRSLHLRQLGPTLLAASCGTIERYSMYTSWMKMISLIGGTTVTLSTFPTSLTGPTSGATQLLVETFLCLNGKSYQRALISE